MKVFLPFKKELNPYLDQIINNSAHDFFYDSYLNFNSDYGIVHIHWPEAIFDWKEPTTAELEELEKCIKEWKQNAVLIYTKHDFQRNKGTTENFTRLFDLIELYTDIFIHLGDFSKNLYQEKYPNARHEILYHPLYTNCFRVLEKEVARHKLNIAQESFVMIVPGTIRNYAERDLILRAFKSIKMRNKVLIGINMHSEIRYDFPGRIKLKRIIDIKNILVERFRQKHKPPKFLFTYGSQSNKDLAIKMSAADLVFIPRIETLNSGMLFLGLTFNKIIVGPSIGNIKEQLIGLDLPVFNPKDKVSVSNAVNNGVQLSLNHKSYSEEKINRYTPKTIGWKMDDLISDLL